LARGRVAADPEYYRFRLAYRLPYDWDAILGFLGSRAIPGVESVAESRYRRTIAVDGKSGVIEVSRLEGGSSLGLSVRFPDPRALPLVVERVRRLFDLDADPAVIAEHLGNDRLLRGPLAKHPGIRAPGAWDGFELAVTAILGPRISGRVAAMLGSPVAGGFGLDRLFPTARELLSAPLERVGVGTARAEGIRSLARQASDGVSAPGWCVDAFPSGDPVLRRNAERWRPWRAYAFMLLWQDAHDDVAKPWRIGNAQSGSGRSASLPALRTG
jgi:AraC family transcriptional regulator of adaptative response / DNA-3-methyladenine glycosylase II